MDKRSKYSLISIVQLIVQLIGIILNFAFVKNDFISGIVLTCIFVIPEIVAVVVRNGVVNKKKFHASFYNMLEFTLYVFSIAAFFIPVGYLNSVLPASGVVATSSVEVSLALVMVSIVIMLATIISKLYSSIDKMFE